jgi:hypothetical protein
MQQKKFPYQNRSLENIDGEKWEAIPGYEDYYLVSNFGRIKALEKEISFFIPGKHLVSYTKPEKILSQGLTKRWNSISKEYIFRLSVTLCISQKMKTFVVCRLVYNAFIKKAEYINDNLCISHKDGDGRNNYYENLVAEKISRLCKIAYKRNRFIDLTPYINKTSIAKSAKSRSKWITQYDLNGKRVAAYPSIQEAANATGIDHSNISMAAKGKKMQMGGFVWRYGKGKKKISTQFYHKRILSFRDSFLKPVTQYDLKGNRLNSYSSFKEAAKFIGCSHSTISNAVLNKNLTGKGFIWREGHGPQKINVDFYNDKKREFKQKFSKKILQYNTFGKLIKKYESIKDASIALNCIPDTISKALHGKLRTAKGFVWKFDDTQKSY